MTEYPQFVTEKIESISKRTEINQAEIAKEYEELFNDPFIREDPQFTTDEERHRYAVAVLWTRYVSRPPVKPFVVIPVGFSGLRIARSGVATSNLFAFIKYGSDTKLKRIVFRAEVADMYKEIVLCSKYEVKLGEFSTGDLIADNRAKFINPVATNLTPAGVLEKLNPKRIALKEAEKMPSRIDSTGYVDTLDWRVVRGIIVSNYRGKRDDGTEFGVYGLSDATLNSEPKVTSDGKILRPGFTVWVPPELMVFEKESEIDAIGTITISRKTNEASMNAFLLVPVHAREVGGE